MSLDLHSWNDEEDLLELSVEQKKIQISPKTGMSVDYYNEILGITNLMFLGRAPNVTESVQWYLQKHWNTWRIRTYWEYFAAEWRWMDALLNDKSKTAIPHLDVQIAFINTQIDSMVSTGECDEKVLKKSWNEAYFIIVGDRGTQI